MPNVPFVPFSRARAEDAVKSRFAVEQIGASGDDFMLALAVAYEVGCRSPPPYR